MDFPLTRTPEQWAQSDRQMTAILVALTLSAALAQVWIVAGLAGIGALLCYAGREDRHEQ